MLRYLRIAPAAKTHLLQCDTRLLSLIRSWTQPLFNYTVPHYDLHRHQACVCRYPLFTLRSSRPSLYDEPAPLKDCFTRLGEPNTSSAGSAIASASSPSSSLASPGGGGAATAKTPSSIGAVSPSLISSKFLSPLRHGRWLVHRRNAASLPREAHYRCDICNGIQQPAAERLVASAAAPHGAELVSVAKQKCVPSASPSVVSSTPVTAAGEQDVDRYGLVTATEIANTVMEEAEVAELRYVDPFHVEVLGRLAWASLTYAVLREVKGQLRRSGLTAVDLSQCAAPVARKSESYRRQYRLWVRQKCQDQQAILNCGASKVDFLRRQIGTLHEAAYLVRYAVAAYGLPYELNYFSSVRAMAKLMSEPHQRYICANSEEQLESMRRMLYGGDSPALLECVLSRYSIRAGQSCYALFLDHETKRVVLTFRGSLTPADVVVDVMEGYAVLRFQKSRRSLKTAGESWVDLDSGAGPEECFATAVPLGFYKAVVEAAAQLIPALRTIHGQYPSYDLSITGHSLGGIEASLFHLFYCGKWHVTLQSTSSALKRRPVKQVTGEEAGRGSASSTVSLGDDGAALRTPVGVGDDNQWRPIRFKKIITCTFGAAPVVESKAIPLLDAWLTAAEQQTGSRLISISNGVDCVSRLQMSSLKGVLTKQGTLSPSSTATFTAEASSSSAAVAPGASFHAWKMWVRGCRKCNAPQQRTIAPTVMDEKSLPLLAVPGNVYNITAGLHRPYLLPVGACASETRQQLIVSAASVIQHFPTLYLRSVNEALKHYMNRWQQLQANTSPSSLSSPLLHPSGKEVVLEGNGKVFV